MNRLRRMVRSPLAPLILITLIVLWVYFILQGHSQGTAVHVLRADKKVYVSMGDFGQVVSYEVFSESLASKAKLTFKVQANKKFAIVENPYPKALKKGFIAQDQQFRAFGDFVSTSIFSDTLYMVDTWHGIQRIKEDFSNKDAPALTPFFNAREFQIKLGYAFVPGGETGLYIYEIRPSGPVISKHVGVSGVAESLLLRTKTVKEFTIDEQVPGQPASGKPVEKLDKMYLAAGPQGVVIFDLTFPLTPTVQVTINTDGYAHAVDVDSSFTLYVANGTRGLAIYDVLNPGKFSELGRYDTNGEVLDVAENDNWVAFADGNNGLLFYRKNKDIKAMLEKPYVYKTPGYVYSVELVNNYAIVADGIEGLRVIDLAYPEHPVERARAATPGTYNLSQLRKYLWSPAESPEGAKKILSISDMGNEVVFLVFGAIFWMLAFFLFILPAPLADPMPMLRFWLQNTHGPPLVIEHGEQITPRDYEHHGTSRTLWLDSASAAVVKSPQAQRVLGPGLTFLEPPERLARTLDLRPESLTCGPEPDEDPFAAQQPGETPEQYRARQARRQQTSGATRDGIEVIPTILVDVRISGNPGDGGSEYGFDPQNALLAMQPEIYEYEDLLPFTSPARKWRNIPVNLVTHLWGQYLRKFSLEELFTPLADPRRVFGAQPSTGLERIQKMLLWHLTLQTIPRLDDQGQPVGKQACSEFQALNRSGLRVSAVQITELRLPLEHAERYLMDWQHGWLPRVQQQVRDLEQTEARLQQSARREARQRFVDLVTRPLRALLARPQPAEALGKPRDLAPTLASLVRGTLNLKDLTEAQRQRLNELLAWLEDWNQNGT